MILIDFTQIAIGSLMVAINRGGQDVDDGLVRTLVLNNLKYYRTRFHEKYGELVICCDSKHYWRRDYFPNYKANRKKDRANSGHDWDFIFTSWSVREIVWTFDHFLIFSISISINSQTCSVHSIGSVISSSDCFSSTAMGRLAAMLSANLSLSAP